MVVTLILMFVMSIVGFFANRSFIFEQKTSANQVRSTRAFEAAEAGLEWAVGKLNDPSVLDAVASCAPATASFVTKVSFRDRYIAPTARSGSTPAGFYPPANSRAGCSVSDTGVLSCSCSAPGTWPTLGTSTDSRFVARFAAVVGDVNAVEIVVNGCTSSDAACDGSVTSTADALAEVRALIKVVPTLSQSPQAALVTGSATIAGGALSIVNTDQASNGIAIDAGTSITGGSAVSVQSLPGTPPSAAMLDYDYALQDLTNADLTGDLFFQSFFGKSFANYKADPMTKVVSGCGNDTACGTVISGFINQGFTQFWVDSDATFTNGNLPASGTLGTAAKPVFIASSGNLALKSNLTAYGFLYAATATADENYDYAGSGSGTLFGAIASRGDFNKGTGTLNIVYDPSVFGTGGAPSGLIVKVPGSWRDKSTSY